MVQVEAEFDIVPVVRVDTFTDLPGVTDHPAAAGMARRPTRNSCPRPRRWQVTRRLPSTGARLRCWTARLVAQDRQLVAALPSTREIRAVSGRAWPRG